MFYMKTKRFDNNSTIGQNRYTQFYSVTVE